MSEMPDDIRKAAADLYNGLTLYDPVRQIAFAILAERTRCAAEAYNKGWSDCYDEPRPFFAAREAGLARYLKTIRGEA